MVLPADSLQHPEKEKQLHVAKPLRKFLLFVKRGVCMCVCVTMTMYVCVCVCVCMWYTDTHRKWQRKLLQFLVMTPTHPGVKARNCLSPATTNTT